MIEVKQTNSKDLEIKKEVLLLEDPIKAEAFRIMNMMSPSNVKSDIMQKAQEIKIKEDFNNALYTKYKNTKLFKEKDIIKECVKFNMYFGPSKEFEGELSLDLISKISSFLKENNLLVSEDQYRSNIFMLGYIDFYKKNQRGESKFKINQKDPLIFFEVREKGEIFYILIDGNTSYKNLLNRFKGYFFYCAHNSRLIFGFLIFAIFLSGINTFSFTGMFHLTWWKWFLLIPCYGIGSIINNVLYEHFEESSNMDREYLKSNMRFYGEKCVNVKFKDNVKESLFIFSLFFSVLFVLDGIWVNQKLKKEGSFTISSTSKTRISEKEIKAHNFIFDPNKLYYENKTITTTYLPGTIFFTKKEETSVPIYTTEQKR